MSVPATAATAPGRGRLIGVDVTDRRREDLAWLAGFWDGEGSVWLTRNDAPSFGITQAGDEGDALCRRVLEITGLRGAVYPQPSQSARRGWKPYWRVMINGHEQVQAALAMCWPWLSQTKRRQAIRALSVWRARKASFVHPHSLRDHCKNGHPFTPENVRMRGRTRICLQCRRAAGLAAYYRNHDENKRRGAERQKRRRKQDEASEASQ